MHRDNFSNATCRHTQRVVSLFKGTQDVEVRIDLTEALVVDHEERIDVARHLIYAVEGLIYLSIALKLERDRYDTDGEDSHILRFASDDGRCACTRSATHTGGNESHLGAVLQHTANIIYAFFGCFARSFGAIACTEAFFS